MYMVNAFLPFYRCLINAPKVGLREILQILLRRKGYSSQQGFVPLFGSVSEHKN